MGEFVNIWRELLGERQMIEENVVGYNRNSVYITNTHMHTLIYSTKSLCIVMLLTGHKE